MSEKTLFSTDCLPWNMILNRYKISRKVLLFCRAFYVVKLVLCTPTRFSTAE